MALTAPDPILHAFASQAAPTYITTIPDDPTGSAHASWKEGFPPITMTALGEAPWGSDFNGVLLSLSQYAQWQAAGGPFRFNTSFSSAIGGYPTGATVRSSDNLSAFVNRQSGNTSSPETAANVTGTATGWDFFAQAGPGTTFGRVMKLTDSSVSANVVVLTSTAYPNYRGGLVDGTIVVWTAAISNTGATVLRLNGITSAGSDPDLLDYTGTALAPGSLTAGRVYSAVYDAAVSKFKLLARASLLSHYRLSGNMSLGLHLNDGSSTVLTQNASPTALAVEFTAQAPCMVTLGGSHFGYGTDTGAAGGGHCGYRLAVAVSGSSVSQSFVWLSNVRDTDTTTPALNTVQTVVNTSSTALSNSVTLPQTTVQLDTGDTLYINFDPEVLITAWTNLDWAWAMDIAIESL